MASDPMSTTPTLLACPFCGAVATAENDFGKTHWVQCEEGHTDGLLYGTEAEARAAWNRRAALTQGAETTIEWQVRGRHHYEWRRASEEIARAMYMVNPGHVRAVTVVEGAVPKAG